MKNVAPTIEQLAKRGVSLEKRLFERFEPYKKHQKVIVVSSHDLTSFVQSARQCNVKLGYYQNLSFEFSE